MSDVRVCRHCGEVRDLGDLLEVTRVRDGQLTWICRPTDGRSCFNRSVRRATDERIRPATGGNAA